MISLLLPPTCAGCGGGGAQLCAGCVEGLVPVEGLECPRGLEWCAALFAYEGVGKRVVAGLKYRRERGVVATLAPAMAELVDPGAVDAVTWAPTSARRRRQRGYDQAEALARAVARSLDRPVARMLRHAEGGGLTGRSRADRQGAVRFEVRAPAGAHERVLVVDDVVTTGATLSAAADALSGAGARALRGLTLAATPL